VRAISTLLLIFSYGQTWAANSERQFANVAKAAIGPTAMSESFPEKEKVIWRAIRSAYFRNLFMAVCVVALHTSALAIPVFETQFTSNSSVAGESLDNIFFTDFGAAPSYASIPAEPDAGTTGLNFLQAAYAPKTVKASASASGSSTFLMSTYTQVAAKYRDTFFLDAIDSTGLRVFSGTFTATATFSGTAEASGSGSYNALATVFGSMTVGNIGSPSQRILTTDGSRPLFLPVSINVPWVAGAPIPILMQAVAEASGSAGNQVGSASGSFSAEGDLMSTIEWTGITEVLDGNGNPVSSFTAMSADGIDYATGSAVVPLPATAWLFGSAIIGAGLINRRKRKKG
jgi:hypothetical protein